MAKYCLRVKIQNYGFKMTFVVQTANCFPNLRSANSYLISISLGSTKHSIINKRAESISRLPLRQKMRVAFYVPGNCLLSSIVASHS